jgi:hypothetical protein
MQSQGGQENIRKEKFMNAAWELVALLQELASSRPGSNHKTIP